MWIRQKGTGAIVSGPNSFTHRKKYLYVLRSANVDKDSREQFEIRTHKRLIDIFKTKLQDGRLLMIRSAGWSSHPEIKGWFVVIF